MVALDDMSGSDYDDEYDTEGEKEDLDPAVSAVFSDNGENDRYQKSAEKFKNKVAKKNTVVHKESILKNELMNNKVQILSVEQNEQAAAQTLKNLEHTLANKTHTHAHHLERQSSLIP